MDFIGEIAERKIREAMERGDFDHLAGKGKPLQQEDLSTVPEELRMAYKVMKNAGFVPPEVELGNEIYGLRQLIDSASDEKIRREKQKELNYKLLKLNMMRKHRLNLDELTEYRDKVVRRLTGGGEEG